MEIQDNDDNKAKDTSVIIIKGGRVVDPVSKQMRLWISLLRII